MEAQRFALERAASATRDAEAARASEAEALERARALESQLRALTEGRAPAAALSPSPPPRDAPRHPPFAASGGVGGGWARAPSALEPLNVQVARAPSPQPPPPPPPITSPQPAARLPAPQDRRSPMLAAAMAAAAATRREAESGPPSPRASSARSGGSSPAAAPVETPEGWSAERVAAWVAAKPFGAYAGAFLDNYVCGRMLATLGDEDLAAVGVGNALHRRAILLAVRDLLVNGGAQ